MNQKLPSTKDKRKESPKPPVIRRPLKFNPKTIPAELKKLDQWVLWRYEQKDGEWTKPPYQMNERLASTTNPATWTSFNEALRAMETGKFDGIGFVLTTADPYCVFDFDHCYNDGRINTKTEEHVRQLGSYTEITPGGKGLHVWVRAKLPGSGKKKGDFECYDNSRYLTVTGKIYGPAAAIENRPEEAVSVQDDIFRNEQTSMVTKKDKKDALFDRLWNGDYSNYPSRSEADLALCNFLARTSKDPAWIDARFRESKLMRPKWDEKHGERTYGQMTVGKVILASKQKEPPFTLASYEDFMEEFAGSEVEWLVEGWLQAGSVGKIIGPPGDYKTWILIDLIVSVASGTPFLGKFKVERPGPVVIFQQEDGHRELSRRLSLVALSKVPMEEPSHGKDGKQHWLRVPPKLPIQIRRRGALEFDKREGIDLLGEITEATHPRPRLFSLDPLYSAISTKDYMMDAPRNMLAIKEKIREKYGTGFILSHHSRKSGKAGEREEGWGSQFLNAFDEFQWQVRLQKDGSVLVKRTSKSSGPQPALLLWFDIKTEKPDWAYSVRIEKVKEDETEEAILRNQKIIRLKSEGYTHEQIRVKLKCAKKTVVRVLKDSKIEEEEDD